MKIFEHAAALFQEVEQNYEMMGQNQTTMERLKDPRLTPELPQGVDATLEHYRRLRWPTSEVC